MKPAIIGFFATLTACSGAAWDHTVVAPPSVARATRVSFEQYCTFNGANDLTEINEFLRRQAQAGWELVGIGGRSASVYCFKARTVTGPGDESAYLSGQTAP
jgi:hypothetical protein